MRRAVVAMAAGALLAVGVPVATADTPGCVTKGEFGAVRHGWKAVTVHRRFDARPSNTAYVRSPRRPGGIMRVDTWGKATCSKPRRTVSVGYVRRHTGGSLSYVVRIKCWWVAGRCRSA